VVPSHFPLGRVASPKEPPHQRLSFPFRQPVLSRDGASAATGAPLGGDIKRLPEIANPTGVDNEVVSHIRHRARSVLGTSTKSLEPASFSGWSVAYDISTANDGMPMFLE